ncbi:uncharacterized protein LOC656610 [Tribolium castaneum]|uniref:Uncharacterized protein n=1 Tax=Tribolium castaneum TaxID=7070 RepID=D6WSA4_TRICA|nr:PREDICTED: uncharacterized protein LOC656610 [Tribolium castaneum]EFA05914.1 hypothetical protein TcasGA2_TC008730 [Tribolium castaneum]|eukprot:XP_968219.1 PREDICTED: uncharacterized protein LOC656610 [Tribolium castaneum]
MTKQLPLLILLLVTTWTLCEGGSWSRSWYRASSTGSQRQPVQSASWSKSWNTQQSSVPACSGPDCKTQSVNAITEPLNGDCSGDCDKTTCPSCMNLCSSRCASNLKCSTGCLNQCSCENPVEPEPETPCCHVLHPPTCFSDDYGNNQCFIRRHKECSNMCTSPVVSIQPGGNTRGCHYINNYPYVYCGNYERQDCGSCYSCDSGNPQQCSKSSGCNNGCRNTPFLLN